MKYIKTFEDNYPYKITEKKYWLVKTTEPYYEISLKKIGIPTNSIGRFLDNNRPGKLEYVSCESYKI